MCITGLPRHSRLEHDVNDRLDLIVGSKRETLSVTMYVAERIGASTPGCSWASTWGSLEEALSEDGPPQCFANHEQGIQALMSLLAGQSVALVVLETTGGLERRCAQALPRGARQRAPCAWLWLDIRSAGSHSRRWNGARAETRVNTNRIQGSMAWQGVQFRPK